MMDEEKIKKKRQKDEYVSDEIRIKTDLFGSRGYSEDIFSTIKNAGLEVSTPVIWNTDLNKLTDQNKGSVMRHLGKTIKLMEDKKAANNAAIQNRLNHPLLKNPFFYVFIAYGIFMVFSFILMFL